MKEASSSSYSAAVQSDLRESALSGNRGAPFLFPEGCVLKNRAFVL